MVASYICSSEIAGAPAASLFPPIRNLASRIRTPRGRIVYLNSSAGTVITREIQTVQIAEPLTLVVRFTWTPIRNPVF